VSIIVFITSAAAAYILFAESREFPMDTRLFAAECILYYSSPVIEY
jgi:hypothetical protein